MFIAHLPSGYIAAYYSQDCCQPHDRKFVFWGWLVGSILPDVDMLYFYLIDREATHHHLYWTHLAVFWLSLWDLKMGSNEVKSKFIQGISSVSLLFNREILR